MGKGTAVLGTDLRSFYFPRRKSHGLWDGALESNEERTRLTAVSLDILAPSSSPRLREELEEWVEEGRRRMAMEDMYGVRNQYYAC